MFNLTAILLSLMLATGCVQTKKDSLSLWNETAPAKQALISYIQTVTNPKSADFIPERERIGKRRKSPFKYAIIYTTR